MLDAFDVVRLGTQDARRFETDGAVFDEGLPGREYARHMVSVDQPNHTRLRGLSAAAFKRSRLTALEPRIELAVEELLAGLEAQTEPVVDLVHHFAAQLPFTCSVS